MGKNQLVHAEKLRVCITSDDGSNPSIIVVKGRSTIPYLSYGAN